MNNKQRQQKNANLFFDIMGIVCLGAALACGFLSWTKHGDAGLNIIMVVLLLLGAAMVSTTRN